MSTTSDSSRNRSKSSSTTAVLVAVIRAVHLRFHETHIFEDSYALQMLPPFWHAVASHRFLKWLVGDVILGVYRPVYPAVVLRARYTEDQLLKAMDEGVNQYVILGAGFDTFTLRHQNIADRLQVFEVDHDERLIPQPIQEFQHDRCVGGGNSRRPPALSRDSHL